MSKDELDTLRAEADVAAAAAAAEQAAADVTPAPPAEVLAPVDDGFAKVLGTAAGGVGNIVCRRMNVTGMDDAEKDALGGALERLVAAYDIGPQDPKGQAWMGFGLVMLGIFGNRQPLPPKPAGEGAVAVPDVAPPLPTFGETGNATLTLTNP